MSVWLIVWLCIRKGVKSTGWVVWVTVPLPFVLLAVLFFRGVTLSGAGDGIRFLLEPDFSKLFSDYKIWTDALAQGRMLLGCAS